MGGRINGDNAIGTGPNTCLTTGAFILIHYHDFQLFIVREGLKLAGGLASGIFALLTCNRYVDARIKFHHSDTGPVWIEGAVFCEGAPELAESTSAANAGGLPGTVRINDAFFL